MADEQKSEKATEKRRKTARQKGQVARSRELPGIAAAAAVLSLAASIAPVAITRWGALYSSLLGLAVNEDLDRNGPAIFWPAVEVLRWIVPLLMAATVASVSTGLLQGGLNVAPQALTFNVQRFSPTGRLGQIFSPIGLANLLKSLLPFSFIAWIVTNIMQANWNAMVNASELGLRGLGKLMSSMLFQLTWQAGAVLLCWAAIDYFVTWRKMESDLKMTRQEVREEHKETDGNPQIKSKIRQLRRRMQRAQSLNAASTATVVITNPTHYAVALRYESDMAAPVVVAKGLDLIAEKIKQLARDSGITLVENRPLAQALYKSVEVGDSIPAKLYQAVAEVLVVVYRAQADVRRREAERRSRDSSGRLVVAPTQQGGTR